MTLSPTPWIAFIRIAVAIVVQAITYLSRGKSLGTLVIAAGRIIVVGVVKGCVTWAQNAVSIFTGRNGVGKVTHAFAPTAVIGIRIEIRDIVFICYPVAIVIHALVFTVPKIHAVTLIWFPRGNGVRFRSTKVLAPIAIVSIYVFIVHCAITERAISAGALANRMLVLARIAALTAVIWIGVQIYILICVSIAVLVHPIAIVVSGAGRAIRICVRIPVRVRVPIRIPIRIPIRVAVRITVPRRIVPKIIGFGFTPQEQHHGKKR
jgi:hypothetical protein